MSRDLPSYSQLLDVSDPAYQRRACGAASLAMLLGGCGLETPPSVDEVLARGIEHEAYKEGVGWRHREMATLARSFGVHAHHEDWSGDPDWAAWEHLVDLVARGPVMASVTKDFSPSEDSHLVVICGIDDEQASIYDPFRDNREGIRYAVPVAFLKRHWTQRVLCLHASRQ